METTTLSSKGHVLLPKSVRETHAWKPGTEFIVQDTPDGILLCPRVKQKPTRLEDVAGSLRYDGLPKTLEDMERILAEEVKERHGRGRY